MADEPIRTEDIMGVRTRVSWGAILAGATTALAVYFLFSLFGVAIGLSVVDNVRGDNFSTGAAVYAVLVSLVALFLGGWVCSMCTAGENKMEAGAYGVILWGVLFVLMLWLAMGGARLGLSALLGVTDVINVAQTPATPPSQEVAAQAAWWAFAGALLSLIAAVGGALAGAGPSLALRGFFVRRFHAQTHGTTYPQQR